MSERRWAWRVVSIAGVLALLACLAIAALLHFGPGATVLVRNASDAPVCEVTLDPGQALREPTTIARIAARDAVRASVASSALGGSAIVVRYRPCAGGEWIEGGPIDPSRAIVLEGTSVRAGPSLRSEEPWE